MGLAATIIFGTIVAVFAALAGRSARRPFAGDPRLRSSTAGLPFAHPCARFDDGVARLELVRGRLCLGGDEVPTWEIRGRIERADRSPRLLIYRAALARGPEALPLDLARPGHPDGERGDAPAGSGARTRVRAAVDALFDAHGALAVQLADGRLLVDVAASDRVPIGALEAAAELARALLDAPPAPRRRALPPDVARAVAASGAPLAVPAGPVR